MKTKTTLLSIVLIAIFFANTLTVLGQVTATITPTADAYTTCNATDAVTHGLEQYIKVANNSGSSLKYNGFLRFRMTDDMFANISNVTSIEFGIYSDATGLSTARQVKVSYIPISDSPNTKWVESTINGVFRNGMGLGSGVGNTMLFYFTKAASDPAKWYKLTSTSSSNSLLYNALVTTYNTQQEINLRLYPNTDTWDATLNPNQNDASGINFVSKDHGTSTNYPYLKFTYLSYTITTSANNGIVSGAGDYINGKNISLVATPNTGYHFANWTESGTQVSTNATFIFTATANRTLVANFVSNTVNLTSDTNSSSLLNCSSCDVTVTGGNTLNLDVPSTFNTVTVSPKGKLTNQVGNTLTATSLNLNSDDTGTATYVDNGTTSVTTANIQQYLTLGRNWYISSPVTGANKGVLNTASRVDYYDEPTSQFLPLADGSTLSPMKGYISVSTTGTGSVTFSGTLNTGVQTATLSRTPNVSKSGFNLAGNPYPSYVNWESATKTNLESTIWYRTKNKSQSYVYDTYGAIAGQGTNNNGTAAVTACIPPMQSFWVRVLEGQTSGTLSFSNSMRSHVDLSTNNFRAPSALKAAQQVLRLQVSNGINSDEAIVLLNPNASNGYDEYDSPKMSNANAAIPEIYTLAGIEQVVINGLNNVTQNEELPLGFTTGQANTFSIKATEISNFDENTRIILKDNVTNSEQDLSTDSTYNFTSDITSTENRFSLIFRSPSITTDINNGNYDKNITIYRNTANRITIQLACNFKSQSSVIVYNTLGQKLITKQLLNRNTEITGLLQPGVYLVTVSYSGKISTKKVILN